jgi:nitrate reductase NapE component
MPNEFMRSAYPAARRSGITSHVMDAGPAVPHIKGMTPRFLILLLAFVGFTVYSVAVVAGHGYLGFLQLAGREPWAMQMLIDLVIALGLFLFWAYGDARAHRLPYWPFAIATLFLGSVGALAYLVVRERRIRRA